MDRGRSCNAARLVEMRSVVLYVRSGKLIGSRFRSKRYFTQYPGAGIHPIKFCKSAACPSPGSVRPNLPDGSLPKSGSRHQDHEPVGPNSRPGPWDSSASHYRRYHPDSSVAPREGANLRPSQEQIHNCRRLSSARLRATDGGGSLYSTVQGEGERLLLMHGLGSSSHTWSGLLPALTQDRQVITVNLPGHGRTPADHDSASFAGLSGRAESWARNMDRGTAP